MEMFATTCVFEGSGKLTIYDKTQGSQNSRGYVTSVFGLKPANVRLINHYVGGAFGSGLRPQHQLFLAAMASLALKTVGAGLVDPLADVPHRIPGRHLSDGVARFRSRWPIVVGDARHRCRDLAARNSQEVVVNWSGLMYHCDNVRLSSRLAKLNTSTPCDMRAPGAASGVTRWNARWMNSPMKSASIRWSCGS